MDKELPLLRFVAHKLNVNAKEVAYFLQIDRRTLYNYANYSISQLPTIVKEKYQDFFMKYDAFKDGEFRIENIYEILDSLSNIDIIKMRADFLRVSNENKKNRILQKEGLTKTTGNEFDAIRESLKMFGIQNESNKLTKGYLYSLFEVIFSKIDKENDYQLIDYISKYKKNDK